MDHVVWQKTQYNFTLKKIICDRGGEFINNSMKQFCQERGIIIQNTMPYTPEQNGIAERKNRTLKECARSILIDSKLGH